MYFRPFLVERCIKAGKRASLIRRSIYEKANEIGRPQECQLSAQNELDERAEKIIGLWFSGIPYQKE